MYKTEEKNMIKKDKKLKILLSKNERAITNWGGAEKILILASQY